MEVFMFAGSHTAISARKLGDWALRAWQNNTRTFLTALGRVSALLVGVTVGAGGVGITSNKPQFVDAQANAQAGGITVKDVGNMLVQLEKDLRSENIGDRKRAALALGYIGDRIYQTVGALTIQLSDPDADDEVRIACARALGRLGPRAESAVRALANLVRDSNNKEVRKEAASAISGICSGTLFVRPTADHILPILEKAVLKDEDAGVRTAAMWALAAVAADSDAAVPILLHILKNGKSLEERGGALSALSGVGRYAKDAVPTLLTIVNDKSEVFRMREIACDALGRIGHDEKAVIPMFVRILADPTEGEMHGAVLVGIRGFGPKGAPAAAAVITLMANAKKKAGNEAKLVYYLATNTLLAIGLDDAAAREQLQQIANDTADDWLRARIAKALGKKKS
jgi:HEAT repeat protein